MNKKKKKLKNTQSYKKQSSPKEYIYIILLAVIVIAAFARITSFDFVNIDDSRLIHDNPLVVNSTIPYSESFDYLLFNPHYKPMVMLSWKAQYNLWGGDSFHFHLMNWLLHLANTLLVFFIAKSIFQRFIEDKKLLLFSAFALAVFFSINPLRIESVAWATERKDVLFSFFFLGSWLLYINFIKRSQYYLLISASLLYLMSGLSKSMGLTLIAVVVLTDIWYNRGFSKRIILEKLPFLAVFLVLIYLYGFIDLESLFQSNNASLAAVNRGSDGIDQENHITSVESIQQLPFILQWFFTTSVRFVLWIVHSLIPVKLSVIYPHDKVFAFIGKSIFLFPIVIAAVYYWAWRKRKTHLPVLAGLLFWMVTLSPALALSSSGQAVFLSDRYTYIPSIGLFFLVVYFLNKLKFGSTKFNLAYAALFILYFLGTIINVGHWKNSETLFKQALKVYPESGLAHLNLGRYYRQNNQPEDALKIYSQGITRAPGYYKLYSNRGKIFFDSGSYDIALEDYNKCLNLKPDYEVALANRGAVYGMKKQWDKSLKDLTKAIEIDPTYVNALKNRGYIYHQLNEYQKNIEDYRKYLELVPNDADVINTIGLCYFKMRDFDNAIREYNKSIQINPQAGIFYLNRSLAYNAIGNKQKALEDAQKAIQQGVNVNQNYLRRLQN